MFGCYIENLKDKDKKMKHGKNGPKTAGIRCFVPFYHVPLATLALHGRMLRNFFSEGDVFEDRFRRLHGFTLD